MLCSDRPNVNNYENCSFGSCHKGFWYLSVTTARQNSPDKPMSRLHASTNENGECAPVPSQNVQLQSLEGLSVDCYLEALFTALYEEFKVGISTIDNFLATGPVR